MGETVVSRSGRVFSGMVYPDAAPVRVDADSVRPVHMFDVPASLREHACTFLDGEAADGQWWAVGEFRYAGEEYADYGWGSEFLIHPRTGEHSPNGYDRVWERVIGSERFQFAACPNAVTVRRWSRARRRWEWERTLNRPRPVAYMSTYPRGGLIDNPATCPLDLV